VNKTSAATVRSLVREVLFGEAGDDPEEGPIGPSPQEKIRATGDPVSFKSDIPKIKNVISKVQASPAYKIGTGAWSGGLVGAAKAAGMRLPSALAKPGEFLTRPEVSMAIGATAPEAGSASTAARGIWGAATKGIGSSLGRALGSTRFVPELNPVASASTYKALAMTPLSGKDPLKK
jgi:hypothetical protein